MSSSNNRNISLLSLILRPSIALVFLVLFGTYMYMHIQNWSFLDSLFMSVETLATVGFGTIEPLTPAGKIFTIVYMLFGVILFLYIAAEFAEYVVYINFGKILSRKNMEAKLKNLKDHYIVCGYGRTGAEITSQLRKSKLDFVVIDKGSDFAEMAQSQGFIYLVGDATEDETLEKAGVDRAKGILCSLSDDVDNLYLTVSAKNLNPNLVIVARCIKASNEQKFRKAGATNIILPYEISGRRMVASIVKPLVVDFLEVVMHTQGQELELKMEQFQLENGSRFIGQTILSSELKQKMGVFIVAIKRKGEFITNPSPDTVLEADDYLIILGTNSQISMFEKELKQK